MYRPLAAFLVTILALAVCRPALAEGPSPRELERMTRQLERLFSPLAKGLEGRDVRFTDHGGGLYSLRRELPVAKASGLDLARDDDKPLRTLANGHMAAEPVNPATMVTAVVTDLETSYNLWWAVVNLGEEELLRRTAVRLTGPQEFDLAVADDVLYAANSVQLFWFNPELAFAAEGLYTHRTTVKTGGKVQYKFWAEALVEEPAEPPR